MTGGNFVDLVQKGFYDKMKIQRSDGFVVQTGDPEGEADGYVGKPSKSIGAGPHGERLIPCEIFLKGDKAPLYETTVEDEGRGGEATVLPFSSYGAMGWAREEYDVNSGSSQFFWLLFDSDLTPAGKNVLDGRYPWYVACVFLKFHAVLYNLSSPATLTVALGTWWKDLISWQISKKETRLLLPRWWMDSSYWSSLVIEKVVWINVNYGKAISTLHILEVSSS